MHRLWALLLLLSLCLVVVTSVTVYAQLGNAQTSVGVINMAPNGEEPPVVTPPPVGGSTSFLTGTGDFSPSAGTIAVLAGTAAVAFAMLAAGAWYCKRR